MKIVGHRISGFGFLLALLLSAAFERTAAANQVLLFAETLGTSRYQTALDQHGYDYQVFSDETAFNQAVQNADTAADVVVVDAMANYHSFGSLPTFVQSGGRALLQYWNLTSGSALASAFQAAVMTSLAAPLPICDWGGSTFFSGLSSPLSAVQSGFKTNVLTLQPLTGGQAAAGFTTSPTANQAALVLGQSGRTLVHGFFIEDIESDPEAVQLAQNELDYLFGPLAPASAPGVTVSPASQIVITNGSMTLRAAASGSLPLDYQWQKGGQNIPGATNGALSLTMTQPQQAGAYTVVVSNSLASVTSSVATVSVVLPQPITQILLLVDHGVASPYEAAITNLALPSQRYNDDSNFGAAVAAASPADTLIVADAAAWTHHFSELTAFVQAGGRALLQYWGLSAGSHLAAAFAVSVAQQNTSALPVYDWNATALFAGVGSPLVFNSLTTIHGQELQPLSGAQAEAGFSASPAANQAALVKGNAGRTLVNAFLLEEAASPTQAEQLVANEILVFFPLRITGLSVSNRTATLSWIALPGRNYQVQSKSNLNDAAWSDLGTPLSAPGTTAALTDSDGADQRYYRVLLLP